MVITISMVTITKRNMVTITNHTTGTMKRLITWIDQCTLNKLESILANNVEIGWLICIPNI